MPRQSGALKLSSSCKEQQKYNEQAEAKRKEQLGVDISSHTLLDDNAFEHKSVCVSMERGANGWFSSANRASNTALFLRLNRCQLEKFRRRWGPVPSFVAQHGVTQI